MILLRPFLLAVALVVTAARAEVEFVGILVTPQQTLFTLKEKPAGQSAWRQLGQTFAGYELTAYDAKTDELTLTNAGATTRVRLKDGKVQTTRLDIAGTFTLGHGEKMEVVRATLAFDQETVFPLKDGLEFHITPQSRPDGSILYRASFERALPGNTVERFSSPSVIARPGTEFSIVAGEYGFSFAPKSP